MDEILNKLISTAKLSPSSFSHAAVLMKNKNPIIQTMSYNIGTCHAEMKCCSKFHYKQHYREKG